MIPASPSAKALLNASLFFGPLIFLLLDSMYTALGWHDPIAANVGLVAAMAYGVTVVRVISLVKGAWQTALILIGVIGVVGLGANALNSLHVGLGAADLYPTGNPLTIVFKAEGFFFPLTWIIASLALGSQVPVWNRILLALGGLVFPVAHVANIGWLAITDAVIMVLALGGVYVAIRDKGPVAGSEPARR
jgi:hypothetical protein